MKRITGRLLAAGIGAAATVGMISVPAGAATASPAHPSAVALRSAATSAKAPTIYTSPYFAGYADTDPHNVRSLTGSFVVPTVTCPGTSEVNIAGSIYDSQGALDAASDLVIDCPSAGGVPTYAISALTYSTAGANVTVLPGDFIDMSESIGTTTTTVTTTDTTAGTSSSATDASGLSGHPANTFFIGSFDDTPTVPTFTSITFSALVVNSAKLPIFTPLRFNETSGKQIMVRSTRLKADGFLLDFVSNG